ncbi:T9SS type A sorting domain-containing protein [Flavobacterium jejuense]|uniref:T9SS type A sorting domain-containing protein n=1 Tax=Flavobacterium jejuense TaxID=1544455 RepID=A0ABX0IPD7_9FLAO|nr:T9SS type A sorting domain-containing protein [Flavobacterium jejuense]NHN25670.1 T9SS type A sorting domain-containing protein [Flavobacterium jejuense]
MKNSYFFLLLFTVLGYSQFNPSAPWKENNVLAKKGKLTLDEEVNLFNEYWSTRNKNIKGSGYKPFMRWENHWKNLVNDQGYVITPQEFYTAWNEKNNAKLNKNSTFSLPTSNWQAVGPSTHTNTGSWSSGQGRVNVVYQDPTNANTVYIGAPAGGIWKSTDAGVNWTPLSDYLPQIGVSGIVVDHTNSNIIYIATGDNDGSDSYSVGVLKSIDGGLTWNTTGLSFNTTNTYAGDIIMHPTNHLILFCATSTGLYKTIDGGTSWTNVRSGNFSRGSVRFKPSDPTIVYGVTNTIFYKSINTGSTFTQITSGLPASSSRLRLDVTPANPNYVYILSHWSSLPPFDPVNQPDNNRNGFQGIYRSTDSGTTFTLRNNSTNVLESPQSYYDLALAVSDTNADEIYTGCLNVWKSTNGGTSLTKLNNWNSPTAPAYTHADIHYLRFYNGNLFCGSDGGVYKSTNGGTSFTDLTATAQISQFYRISVSKQSAGNMVGGLQDNGGHAYSGGGWKNYYGADGMDTAINPNDPNAYYGFIQFGGTLYLSNNAGNNRTGSVSAPAAETGTNDDGGNWITPLKINSAGEVFAAYERLYKLNGGSWVQQSLGTIGSGNIENIEISPINDDIMFVSNGTTLYKSIDHGINFTISYTASSTITSIECHNSDVNIIYLTTSGAFGKVLQSTDGGSNFIDITSGIPNVGKNIIVHQNQNTDNPIYVGTSLGVYYKDDTMSLWEPFDTNLPNVSVTDLEINLNDAKLIAATYGRGIWQTDIPIQIPSNDIKLVQIQNPTTNISCGANLSPEVEIKNNGLNPITSATFNYTIDATPYNYNWNGNLSPNTSTVVVLPFVTLSRGQHSISISTTTTNDAFPDNNNGSTTFNVNDNGTIGIVNTFTTAADELISYNEGSTGSQWTRTVRSGGLMDSAGNSVYSTNSTGNYPDNTKSYLVSQCYDLTSISNPEIRFSFKYDLENNWDIVYVEYSTDFGANWSVLGEKGPNWYNSDRTNATSGASDDCQNCPGAQWTGANTTNTSYFYPLNTLNSEANIIFRIVFHSDQSVNKTGANLDNFVINGTTLSSDSFELDSVFVYPNPSNGLFTVSTKNRQVTSIEVYDVSGKNILNRTDIESSNEITLDLTHASIGIYFMKINSEIGSITKRIIKK